MSDSRDGLLTTWPDAGRDKHKTLAGLGDNLTQVPVIYVGEGAAHLRLASGVAHLMAAVLGAGAADLIFMPIA